MKERFVNIQEWMLDLKLKGNELIIFAIIYGFSQDGESVYAGSLEYLCKWTNSTKQGVLKTLKSLIDKGLIVKNKVVNKVYYSTLFTTDEVNKVESEGKQSLMEGKQSLPNNTLNNNINNNLNNINKKKSKTFIPPTYDEVCVYIHEKNYSIDPKVFFDYYEATEWHDKDGNKIKNWKGKVVTWNSRNKQSYSLQTKNKTLTPVVTKHHKLTDAELKEIPF